MTDYRDITIARALGWDVREDFPGSGFWFRVQDGFHMPLPDFGKPEGSWLVLDYIREDPDSDFARAFCQHVASSMGWFDWIEGAGEYFVSRVLLYLTPSLVKQAAFKAAKGVKE